MTPGQSAAWRTSPPSDGARRGSAGWSPRGAAVQSPGFNLIELPGDAVGSLPKRPLARNGVEFGTQTSGTGDRWFTTPAPIVDGLYFPGYSIADAAPDLGESAITETAGLGGFAIAADEFRGESGGDRGAQSRRYRDCASPRGRRPDRCRHHAGTTRVLHQGRDGTRLDRAERNAVKKWHGCPASLPRGAVTTPHQCRAASLRRVRGTAVTGSERALSPMQDLRGGARWSTFFLLPLSQPYPGVAAVLSMNSIPADFKAAFN